MATKNAPPGLRAGPRGFLFGAVAFLFAMSICCPRLFASERVLDDLEAGKGPRWEEKRFLGSTSYTAAREEGRPCIRAQSRGSASGLYYKISFDPVSWPVLSWTWKIAHALGGLGEGTRKGDDFAARVYVVFPSVFFWRTRAINYVWAAKLPKGKPVASPYTRNAFMIPVESGPDKAGTWVSEERDIAADYRLCFGREPPPAGAVAIMTDTDQTGASAVAWYGPIRLRTGPENPPTSAEGSRPR